MTRVCILGLGYIGLPTACMFAKAGMDVLGVDVNPDILQSLKQGKIHIEEPGLEEIFQQVIKSGKLTVGNEPKPSDAFIICVPTPLGSDKHANLDYVKAASKAIVPNLRKGSVVILESTVPPRTTVDVVKPILQGSGLKAGEEFYLAFCPERVIPNRILIEIVENDRICGGINEVSTKTAKDLYKTFVKGEIFESDSTTAEMVKLMENTFRDVNIALANEFAIVAGKLGVNIWEAIHLANKHPRVNIHQPGPGVGGHCIPVVPWFIVEKDVEGTPLIQIGRRINDSMPELMFSLIKQHLPVDSQTIVTVLGVAFKANTDDASYTPALDLIKHLESAGFQVRVHDPLVHRFSYPLLGLVDAVSGSDCVVIVTDHDEYKHLDLGQVRKLMRGNLVFDTRNVLDKNAWREKGFNVITFGITSVE